MKALLISIRPQWVALIFNLIKKDEIRKGTAIGKAINKLIKEQGVAPMLIYCTKDTKNIYRIMRSYNNKVLKLVASSNTIQEELKDENTINGKVVAQFNATADKILCFIESQDSYSGNDAIYEYSAGEYSSMILRERSCLTYEEMLDYFGEVEGECGTAIHINDLAIFDEPKELWQFKTPIMAERYKRDLEQAYEDDYEIGTRIAEGMANDDECANCVKLTEMSEGYYGLQRAPQSWCYIDICS